MEARVVELINEGYYRQRIFEKIDKEISLYKIDKIADKYGLSIRSGVGSKEAMNTRRKNNFKEHGHINAGVSQQVLDRKFNNRLTKLNKGRVGDHIISKENIERVFKDTNSVIDTARWFDLAKGNDTGALRRICKQLDIDLTIVPNLKLTKEQYIKAYKKHILRKKFLVEENITQFEMELMEREYGLYRDDIVSKEDIVRAEYLELTPDLLTVEEITTLIRKHITKKAFARDEKSISYTRVARMMEHHGMDWFDAITVKEWEDHVGRIKSNAWANDPTIYEKQIASKRRNGTLRVSNFEREVSKFIRKVSPEMEIITQDRTLLGNLELDILIPSLKLAIECNGMFRHNEDNLGKYYHINKSREVAKKGYRLIHIYEWEWKSERTKPIIKSILKSAVGRVDNKVYARQCEIKELSNPEYRAFLKDNHLQGFRPSKVRYGLYYEDQLVQVMGLGPRIHTASQSIEQYGWEIIRSATKKDLIVVGGLGKLFKHFIRNHNPDKVMSFADYNKFGGKGYESLGMTKVGSPVPNRWFVNQNTGKVSNWLFRGKEKRDELLKNTYSVWGSGNLTYEWNKKEKEKEENEE